MQMLSIKLVFFHHICCDPKEYSRSRAHARDSSHSLFSLLYILSKSFSNKLSPAMSLFVFSYKPEVFELLLFSIWNEMNKQTNFRAEKLSKNICSFCLTHSAIFTNNFFGTILCFNLTNNVNCNSKVLYISDATYLTILSVC